MPAARVLFSALTRELILWYKRALEAGDPEALAPQAEVIRQAKSRERIVSLALPDFAAIRVERDQACLFATSTQFASVLRQFGRNIRGIVQPRPPCNAGDRNCFT